MLEIPLWVATLIVGALLGGASYLIKLILDLDRRVTRIETKLNGKEKS